MEKVTRFGISVEKRLAAMFDEAIERKGYTNRSEAIQHLMRDWLVDQDWAGHNVDATGVITVVYNCRTPGLQKKLSDIRRRHLGKIVSSMHVYLDGENCLEVIVLTGGTRDIRTIHGNICSTRGVKHCKLTSATAGRNF